jgi:hypothetical protein
VNQAFVNMLEKMQEIQRAINMALVVPDRDINLEEVREVQRIHRVVTTGKLSGTVSRFEATMTQAGRRTLRRLQVAAMMLGRRRILVVRSLRVRETTYYRAHQQFHPHRIKGPHYAQFSGAQTRSVVRSANTGFRDSGVGGIYERDASELVA